MNWNKTSDDFDEGIIDFDGDGSLRAEKKKSSTKYPNAPAVRKIFQEVLGKNPPDWKINSTVLKACEELFAERGVVKIKNALQFFVENQDKEYCPIIDSPVDLNRKYEKLSRFKTSL